MKKKRICAVLSAFILSAAPVFGAFAVSAEDLAVPKGWLLWHSYTSYEAGDSQLYLQNPQGEISEITGDFIHAMNGNFGKSPDDIVFMAIDENADEWDIFLYEDKTVTNLTENSGYRNEDPKWSPDGKSIVFKRGYWNADVNDFTYNLAWMDLERKEIKMLTDSLYEEAMPHFSEDGRYIYYTKYMEGYGKISRLNTETGEDELIFEEEKVNAYYPAVKNGFLYFTKWFSDDNHHDEIMIYADNTLKSAAFNSERYDCSDACPIDGDKMIYSSTIKGSYSLYYADGDASVEIPEVNTDRNELGADFFSYAEYENLIRNTVLGDVNADGELNIADVVLLQKWLLAVPDVSLANWEAADLCQNGELNVLDLCLMKRELLRSVQYSLPESPEKS